MGICDPTGTLEEDEVYVHNGLGTVRYIHILILICNRFIPVLLNFLDLIK